jgi:hypothetical protein
MRPFMQAAIALSIFLCTQRITLAEPVQLITSGKQEHGFSVFPLRGDAKRRPVRVVVPPGLARSTIRITYANPAEMPDDAERAFERAARIWETYLVSIVPIDVRVEWKGLKQVEQRVPLATAYTNLVSDFPSAPKPAIWYPYSLANSLSQVDLAAGTFDFEIAFNSAFTDWYFGLDAKPPQDKWDFVTTALHEIGHGVGFVDSFHNPGDEGSWGFGSGYPYIYDTFVADKSLKNLIDTTVYPNPSKALLSALTSEFVLFVGPNTTSANNSIPAHVYAPKTFSPGSSIAHWDPNYVAHDSMNALMLPGQFNGDAIHHPGPLALGLLCDLGWKLTTVSAECKVERVPELKAVTATRLNTNPPALVVSVIGTTPTAGWTCIQLFRRSHNKLPVDGIWEYDLLAKRPTGMVATQLVDVQAEDIWQSYDSTIKGVRVFAGEKKWQEAMIGP